MSTQEPTETPVQAAEREQSVLSEISREMVRLYKDQFGRGPTKARTAFAGPDLVVCTLEESLTPAEKRLRDFDKRQRLRDTRLVFQHATEAQFKSIIERVLNRKVRAFISGMDVDADVSAEVFYLMPDRPSTSSTTSDGGGER